jgi:hypothetical protein
MMVEVAGAGPIFPEAVAVVVYCLYYPCCSAFLKAKEFFFC